MSPNYSFGEPLLSLQGAEYESVWELTARVKRTLEGDFASVAVVGEISNLSRPRSGHVYLTLKDERASIRGVIWKSTAALLAVELADGMRVRCVGQLTVYEPRGEYQVVIRRVEPDGLGELERILRERREKLEREGLFDRARKRALPRFPCRILVISSPTGAAIRDLLQVMGRRWPLTEVLLAPVRVQGMQAAREVVQALELANRTADIDLVIVTRGGGSLEDLWAFNEEAVVRAITASKAPVITAIGHEIDVTLSDLAADLRALTPSEAGERAVPDQLELVQRLDSLDERLESWARSQLRDARSALLDRTRRLCSALALLASAQCRVIDGLANRLLGCTRDRVRSSALELESLRPRLRAATGPVLLITRNQLERTGDRLRPAAVSLVRERRQSVDRQAIALEALAPRRVLERGYSLTLRAGDEKPIRTPADAQPGEAIITVLATGRIASRVVAPEP